MKKLLLLCVLFGAAVPLWAQQVFFIFIQSDAHAPFYVKMGEKVLSSSASGYLIIPKLKDSTCSFQLGPAAKEGELRFEVPISGKDRGFLLKKFSEGWGLFDLQSMAVIMPTNSDAGGLSGTKIRNDRFTTLLAQASDDTSLLYQPVIATTVASNKRKIDAREKAKGNVTTTALRDTVTEKEKDTSVAVVSEIAPPVKDTVRDVAISSVSNKLDDDLKKDQPAAISSIDADTDTGSAVYKRSVISRGAESSTVEGFGLVYLDDIGGVIDTIRLFIPNQKVVFADAAPVEEVKAPLEQKKAVPAMTCNGQASDKDYFRLRKSLAAIDSEAEMTKAALGVFRKKCFSAEQVKNLSMLFLTQSGKYGFFEAAYPFVFDKDKFTALQSELIDPAYLARFKALTTN